MKKLTSLIYVALLAFNLSGQPFEHQDHDKLLFRAKNNSKSIGNYYPAEYNTSVKTPLQLKNAYNHKQQLDSIVYLRNQKEEYIYNNDHKLVKFTKLNWKDNRWNIKETQDYTYTQNQKLRETIYTKDGNKTIKTEYIYNSEDKLSCYMYYVWSENYWTNNWKIDYYYDDFGNELKNIELTLINNEWVNYGMNEFEYDDAKINKSIKYSRWLANQWKGSKSSEFFYDEEGRRNVIVDYLWISNNPVKSEKSEIIFNSNGNVEQVIGYKWQNDVWIENKKEEFQYDNNLNRTATLTFSWTDNNWSGTHKEELVFDNYGNVLTYLYSERTDNEWKETKKTEQQYECDVPFDALILPFTFPPDFENCLLFRHKLTSISDFLNKQDEWVMERNVDLYYSEKSASGTNTDPVIEQFVIYPNPAIDHFSFRLPSSIQQAQFELYNSAGILVLKGKLDNDSPVQVGSLIRGLYTYRIFSDKNLHTGKISLK